MPFARYLNPSPGAPSRPIAPEVWEIRREAVRAVRDRRRVERYGGDVAAVVRRQEDEVARCAVILEALWSELTFYYLVTEWAAAVHAAERDELTLLGTVRPSVVFGRWWARRVERVVALG